MKILISFMSVINRTRTNKISYFKDMNEQWITNHDRIVDHVLNYYKTYFNTDHTLFALKDFIASCYIMHKIDMSSLDRPLTDFKVKNALF